MAYIQAYSLLSDPEYINIVYICLHANYLNKILFKPIDENNNRSLFFYLKYFVLYELMHNPTPSFAEVLAKFVFAA